MEETDEKDHITNEELILLNALNHMCESGKISHSLFTSVLHDYKSKVDISNFACYNNNHK